MEKLDARYGVMFQTLQELEGKEHEFKKYVVNILKQRRAFGVNAKNRYPGLENLNSSLEKTKQNTSNTSLHKTLNSLHGSIEKVRKASVNKLPSSKLSSSLKLERSLEEA